MRALFSLLPIVVLLLPGTPGQAVESTDNAAKNLTLKEHCDIPGSDLKSMKTKNAEECRQMCQADAGCKAFAYVSGWGKCFFKHKVSRQADLRIHAGTISESSDPKGDRKIAVAKNDHDNYGKDLKRVAHVKSSDACGRECLKVPECKAYAFLDGYGDCWLKKNVGRMVPKIFWCGVKNSH